MKDINFEYESWARNAKRLREAQDFVEWAQDIVYDYPTGCWEDFFVDDIVDDAPANLHPELWSHAKCCSYFLVKYGDPTKISCEWVQEEHAYRFYPKYVKDCWITEHTIKKRIDNIKDLAGQEVLEILSQTKKFLSSNEIIERMKTHLSKPDMTTVMQNLSKARKVYSTREVGRKHILVYQLCKEGN